MQHLIEQYCKDVFRSYKVFRTSGEVVQHTERHFQEWNFSDTHTLTISDYRQHRHHLVAQTDQWTIAFNNRRYYIQIAVPRLQYELISINHTGLVIDDLARGEKIFFARLPTWEHLVQNKFPVL